MNNGYKIQQNELSGGGGGGVRIKAGALYFDSNAHIL